MNAVPDIQEPQASTALTVAQRAAVALNSSEHERKLLELASASKSITEITNKAGREQCNSARMALKRVRVDIEKTGKAAREEAQAFSKAVIAEERRLISLTEPEETRLGKIQSEYDERIAAEKRAKEQAERQRVAAITQRIDEIREIPDGVIGNSSEVIAKFIEMAKAMVIDDTFAEFKSQAEGAKATVIVRLEKLLTVTIASESEARRLAEERAELERQKESERRLAAIRKRIGYIREFANDLVGMPAIRVLQLLEEAKAFVVDSSFEELQAEAEGERTSTVQRLERVHAAAVEYEAERERLAREELQAAERRRVLDEEERAAAQRRADEEARLAAERAELERQQEALRVQQEAVAKPSDPVEATAQEDVTLVVEEGPARPSDTVGPDMSELYYAEMEAARNEEEDAYFAARPDRDSEFNRLIFGAGFERGYHKLWSGLVAPSA